MDRGMSSPETLKLLGQDHRRYILGTPKTLLKKTERGWRVEPFAETQRGSRNQLKSLSGPQRCSLCAFQQNPSWRFILDENSSKFLSKLATK
jgi:hypothetical protein